MASDEYANLVDKLIESASWQFPLEFTFDSEVKVYRNAIPDSEDLQHFGFCLTINRRALGPALKRRKFGVT